MGVSFSVIPGSDCPMSQVLSSATYTFSHKPHIRRSPKAKLFGLKCGDIIAKN